jgi:hypothetical protein
MPNARKLFGPVISATPMSASLDRVGKRGSFGGPSRFQSRRRELSTEAELSRGVLLGECGALREKPIRPVGPCELVQL